jgi:succinate dehydrogenase/fumarate reductase flavoprotein subunit
MHAYGPGRLQRRPSPERWLDQHFRDTIEGGAYLNDQELAWTLITTAPERIRELENRMGCFFDRNPDGPSIKGLCRPVV